MSIECVNSDECYGCGVCSEICSHNAIKMMIDKRGFQVPIVNCSLCVKCELCKSICPALSSICGEFPKTVWAMQSLNTELLNNSSSGGVATIISHFFVEQLGGVVYGVAYDGDVVCHIRVVNTADIGRLSGSKYVQSEMNNILNYIYRDLCDERYVAFFGTPCQIHALKKYLTFKNLELENLLLIDIVCGGVTPTNLSRYIVQKNVSYKTSRDYEIRYRRNIQYVFEVIENSKKRVLYEKRPFSLFYKIFDLKLCLRKSCYGCPYSCDMREGDMTIGDFWGLDKFITEFDLKAQNKGVSLCLLNTIKAELLMEKIKCQMKIEQHTLEEAKQCNLRLKHPSGMPKYDLNIFDELFEQGEIEKAVNKTLPIMDQIQYVFWGLKTNLRYSCPTVWRLCKNLKRFLKGKIIKARRNPSGKKK